MYPLPTKFTRARSGSRTYAFKPYNPHKLKPGQSAYVLLGGALIKFRLTEPSDQSGLPTAVELSRGRRAMPIDAALAFCDKAWIPVTRGYVPSVLQATKRPHPGRLEAVELPEPTALVGEPD